MSDGGLEPGDLEVASAFCKLVQTEDLFEYLGLPKDGPIDEAKAALAKKRKYMQSMQGNPKFKDCARFLIKNLRALDRTLGAPLAHLEAVRREREDEKLPMLMLALDALLAGGAIGEEQEAHLRTACLEIGISEQRYEEVVFQRAEEMGVELLASPKATERPVDVEGVSPEAATTARLRGAEGHGWWDAAFTRLLLEMVPGGPAEMVDVYCRTGLSAMTLLPERPQLTWLGVDRSVERLEIAHGALAAQGGQLLHRVSLADGPSDALPLEDASVDYVLAVRALANRHDTRPVFNEASRVLRPGGRMLAAEPDGFGESFFFNGHLVDYNAAFQALCVAVGARMGIGVDEVGRPGLSIGPTLATRMAAAGLTPKAVRVHTSNNMAPRPFGRLARRLRRYPEAVARSVGLQGSAHLARVLSAVDELERRIPADRVGQAGHTLPMFLVVGEKE